MKYKIMALDIDGTLTNSQKVITANTRNKLIKFQKNGGKIILEIGEEQAESVGELLKMQGITQIGVVKDIQDLDRVIFGTMEK